MTVGFILSPLSWWNDLVVNIPLAYLGGFLAGLFNKSWFMPGMVASYWLTNLLGFLMMRWGYLGFKKENETKQRRKKEMFNFVAISVLYSLLIAIFVGTGILKFPTEYLK